MSGDDWMPLSQRRGHAPKFEPLTGMPKFLRETFRTWFTHNERVEAGTALALGVALRIDVASRLNSYRAPYAITSALGDNENHWLDALDFLLHERVINPEAVRSILARAGHELTVSPDGRSLTERVEPTAADAFKVATAPADVASAHLNEAWTLTFGRDPRPGDGWGYAIKAVEALLLPIVLPADAKATLGKSLSTLRDRPDSFVCTLPSRTYGPSGQETAKSGLELLTDTLAAIGYQPGHHGSGELSEADPAVARSMVLLATTVVSWLRDGVLRRTS